MVSKKSDSILWEFTNQLRGKVRPSQYLEEMINQGVEFSWRDIHPFVSRISESDHTPPNFVVDFIVQFYEDINIINLLDPWSRYGVLLTALVKNRNSIMGTGIEIYDTTMNVAKAISANLPVDWVTGDSLENTQTLDSEFDVVVSAPPFGLKRIKNDFNLDRESIEVIDCENNIVLLEAMCKLNDSGEAVFIQPSNFAWGISNDVSSSLEKFNLFINAIVALPDNSYAPWTSIELNMFFLSRSKTDKVFISYLDPDKNFDELIDDIKSHKEGKQPQKGYLIDLKSFRSYFAIKSQEEIEYEARKSNAPLVRLSQIAYSLKLGQPRLDDGGFEDAPNVVYLPSIGNSEATTRIANLTIKPQNCYQIVLNDNLAMADYIAGYFNTPIGFKIRESLTKVGGAIPRIKKIDLEDALIILPEIEQQSKIVNTKNALEDLKLLFEDLEDTLWSQPYKVQTIEERIAAISTEESFEDWMNRLPFPLASILWRYLATDRSKEKVEHLFHFFEAYSQFIATLLLSAFYSDKTTFNEHKMKWLRNQDGRMNTFSRMDFGSWVTIGERLAKHIRKMQSNKEERFDIFELFGTNKKEFIQTITNKEIYKILQTTNTYRNNWRGHGGISGDVENQRRLTLLETELIKLRDTIRNCFDGFLLYLPQENRHQRGIYYYRAKSIMGSHQLFRVIDVETNAILDDGSLYFQDISQRNPLKLIPFFIMLPSPESERDACYFYSKLDQGTAKWITYHYDQLPETHLYPDELNTFFELLRS